MRPLATKQTKPRRTAAFSLIELLVVLAIASLLTFMVVPQTEGVLRGYKLENTCQNVIGQLGLARQMALIKGRCVEVRFYFLPDYNQATTADASVIRGMQCFVENDPNVEDSGSMTIADTPITKPLFFDLPVAVFKNNSYSTILTLSPSTPQTALPLYQLNYKYISFRFKPNGQTDLADDANLLTLILQHVNSGKENAPHNFRTIAINSQNGTVRVFAP